MNRLIDYDAKFREYFEKWYAANKDKYEKPEEVEQVLPQIYERWMEKECAPLMNIGGSELVGMIGQYASAGMNVPDIVCEFIVRRKNDTEAGLYELYRNNMFAQDVKVLIINMLSQMDSVLPIESFVHTVACSGQEDEVVNACAEALCNTGAEFLEYGVEEYAKAASVGAKELLLNALISRYKDARLADFAIELYRESQNKAFVAAMMGETGDERCLPLLREAAQSKDINYVDYTEICNAIEMLGGEVSREREFEGDVYYEMMKQGVEG